MNRFLFTYLLSYLTIHASLTYAQTDSVRTEYKTEDESISRSEIQRVIRYLTRANVEEKTLLKIGGLPNGTPFSQSGRTLSFGLTTELAIERKLTPAISVLVGFDNQTSFGFYQPFPVLPGASSPTWQLNRSSLYTSSAKAAVRYYYNMPKRIQLGKQANNFSGTYIAFQVRRPVLYRYASQEEDISSGAIRHSTQNYSLNDLNSPSYALQWGIQQRLGRHGYVDLNAGPKLTVYKHFSPVDVYNSLRYGTTLPTLKWQFRLSAVVGLSW